uniref:Uncharacterized protein n=1 Tax=Leersia perrieri TaxID=77586 RepID=A0A0D9V0F4_9ORYZ
MDGQGRRVKRSVDEQTLSGDKRDRVLRRGAEIARRLGEEYGAAEDEASAWLLLADFWSEMVELSSAVKDAVVRSLKNSAAERLVGAAGGKVDWMCYDSHRSWASDGCISTTDVILAWHVATRLYEMRSTTTTAVASASSPNLAAACHLSNYCTYLAAAAPELLPDSAAWTEKRYKDVVADVTRRWARMAPPPPPAARRVTTYERLLTTLSGDKRDRRTGL